MTARLTIAIPTFNRAGLLKKALESALAQTSEEIEIFVSDNGSTDATADLIAQYSDPRLCTVRHKVTMPRAQHGTYIFGAATAELVLILSDDDWIEPDFSSEIIKLFDEHPEISFAYTGCIEHYDDAELPALVGPRIESPLEFFAAHYAGKRQVSWCACVTRVADIRACGPQPEDRIIGDMFFWTKIGFKGPVGCVARPLSHYSVLRPAGDNESRSVPILVWGAEVRLLTEEVMQGIRNIGASPAFQTALAVDMKRATVQSLANQFLWARIYGMKKMTCFALIAPSLAFKGWTMKSFLRVVAALVLSRGMIRYLLVKSAKQMGAARKASRVT